MPREYKVHIEVRLRQTIIVEAKDEDEAKVLLAQAEKEYEDLLAKETKESSY